MALEIIGKLAHKYDTQKVSDTFTKREFILDISEDVNGKVYPNVAKFQVTKDKCSVLDNYNVGEEIKVHFNIRGNKATSKEGKAIVFTNLDAWKIERVNAAQQPQAQYQQPTNNNGQGYSQGSSQEVPF